MNHEEPKPKLYFAHPKGTYGTKVEEKAIIALTKLFPHHEIVNPSESMHRQLAGGRITYYKQLLQSCDCLVYLPFGDEAIGSDTSTQIQAMLKKDAGVYELHVCKEDNMPSGMCSRVTSLDQERILTPELTATRNIVLSQMLRTAKPRGRF